MKVETYYFRFGDDWSTSWSLGEILHLLRLIEMIHRLSSHMANCCCWLHSWSKWSIWDSVSNLFMIEPFLRVLWAMRGIEIVTMSHLTIDWWVPLSWSGMSIELRKCLWVDHWKHLWEALPNLNLEIKYYKFDYSCNSFWGISEGELAPGMEVYFLTL